MKSFDVIYILWLSNVSAKLSILGQFAATCTIAIRANHSTLKEIVIVSIIDSECGSKSVTYCGMACTCYIGSRVVVLGPLRWRMNIVSRPSGLLDWRQRRGVCYTCLKGTPGHRIVVRVPNCHEPLVSPRLLNRIHRWFRQGIDEIDGFCIMLPGALPWGNWWTNSPFVWIQFRSRLFVSA